MPAVFTRGPRVHVEALQFFIVHDLQDMRMPADEELRFVRHYFFFGFRVIPGRVAADVADHYFYRFAVEKDLFGIILVDGLIIDIAIHAPYQGKTCPEFFSHTRSEIPGMPYLITWPEMVKYRFIEVTVCVRN